MPLPAYERGARRRTSRPCESPGRRGGGGGRLCGKPRGPVWAGKRITDTAALLRSETSCTGGAPSSRHLAAHANKHKHSVDGAAGFQRRLRSVEAAGRGALCSESIAIGASVRPVGCTAWAEQPDISRRVRLLSTAADPPELFLQVAKKAGAAAWRDVGARRLRRSQLRRWGVAVDSWLPKP